MLKKDVLRNKNDFSSIYKNGKSAGRRYVIVFFKRNGLGYNRTAFLASKKVGNAVMRNRARRLLKESYRKLSDNISIGYDMIFIARNTIIGRTCRDVEKSMRDALEKLRVIK